MMTDLPDSHSLERFIHIVPLGDQAVLACCRDEAEAARLAAGVRVARPAWLVDVVPAYASVAIFFDPLLTRLAAVSAWLPRLKLDDTNEPIERRLLQVPCCYELGPDLQWVAQEKKLTIDEVVQLHCSVVYTVYAIGFCPGFPYLGYLPEPLCGLPRLPSPRLRVEPGSVGLTGRQTGIYPLPRPGGWRIIGQTPLKLVDLSAGYFALAPGDQVQFQSMSRAEFDRMQNGSGNGG